MVRDTLFNTKAPADKFEFNERVAEVFDDMLDRSVPFYKQVIEMTAEILGRSLLAGDAVHDLGCSTGTMLLHLARILETRNLRFVGVDNSKAMLDKALRKAEMFSLDDRIVFIEQDITQADFSGAGGVILNYTLQFIKPAVRPEFLKKIYNGLRTRGVLILSEKIVSPHKEINEQFQGSYYQYKKRRGYSELEIANKREALENVRKIWICCCRRDSPGLKPFSNGSILFLLWPANNFSTLFLCPISICYPMPNIRRLRIFCRSAVSGWPRAKKGLNGSACPMKVCNISGPVSVIFQAMLSQLEAQMNYQAGIRKRCIRPCVILCLGVRGLLKFLALGLMPNGVVNGNGTGSFQSFLICGVKSWQISAAITAITCLEWPIMIQSWL
jgi:tRNA (cmo5U34)-methyltransferase